MRKIIISNFDIIIGKQIIDKEHIINVFVFWFEGSSSNVLIPMYSVRMKIKLQNVNSCPMNKLPNDVPMLWNNKNTVAL